MPSPPSSAQFLEERLIEHIAKDLDVPDIWRRTTALLALMIEHAGERRERLSETLSPLTRMLDDTRVHTVDHHEVGALLCEVCPTHSFALSLGGKLTLWAELFARRDDIEAEFVVRRQPWHGVDATLGYDTLDALYQNIAHMSLSWRFTRSAMRQRHLVPTELHDEITRYHKPPHGGFELGPWESLRWHEQEYPNSWMTVDYHAGEVLKFGKHNTSPHEDLYMIAWKDAPRQQAYVGAASSVDGGSYGGIPACMTHTRYRDLETCLKMGAIRGFCDEWTMRDPEDQDFGAFKEVERELYVSSWFDEEHEDESTPVSPVEEVLARRSASKASGEAVLRARLREEGASEFAAAQLWAWLQEDVALLLCR